MVITPERLSITMLSGVHLSCAGLKLWQCSCTSRRKGFSSKQFQATAGPLFLGYFEHATISPSFVPFLTVTTSSFLVCQFKIMFIW